MNRICSKIAPIFRQDFGVAMHEWPFDYTQDYNPRFINFKYIYQNVAPKDGIRTSSDIYLTYI